LLGCGLGELDDRRDAALWRAQNPAEIDKLKRIDRQEHEARLASALDERLQGFGPKQRHVAVGNQHFVSLPHERGAPLQHGVACAKLFGLHDIRRALANRRADRLGAVPDHKHGSPARHGRRCVERMQHKRPTRQPVQHFR